MKPFNNIAVSPTEPEPKSDVWIQHSKNLFDENTWIVGKGILGTNGQEYSNSAWSSSDYIPIKEAMPVCFSYETIGNGELAISEYDVNKTFLKQTYKSFSSNYNNKIVINTMSNTKFVRLSSRNDKENEKFQLEYGTTRTNYEPYVEDDILVNEDGVYNSVLPKQDYTLNQERKVGKWLNGEDLYEMIVKGTTPATVDGYTNSTINLSEYNIKDCFIKNAWLYQGSNPNVTIRPLPYITNTGNTVKCYYQQSDKSLYISTNESTYKSITIYIIIMYTKN